MPSSLFQVLLPLVVVWTIPRIPVEAEIVGMAVLQSTRHGTVMDPAVALAVHEAESGNVPEGLRDRVVSRTGDHGRMQVNARVWYKALGFATPGEAAVALGNRHLNAWVGTGILARIHQKYAVGPGPLGDRGGRKTWVSRYNGSGERAKRYGDKIIRKVGRLRQSDRRW